MSVFSVVGKVVQVAVLPVAAGVVFIPAVGVALAVGREIGWISGVDSVKTVPAKKTVAKKPAVRKPVAKKPVARKPVAKKQAVAA